MNSKVKTRFAPSPTGYMHIGNLRSALYSYLLGKSLGGDFILRIEDTDQERFVEGATDVIIQTLKDTGITYDEGPGVGGDNGPYFQSERKAIYLKYAEQLIEQGDAYYCFCTEERLKSLVDDHGIGGYDGHCRNLPKEDVKANLEAGIPYVIRQKMPLEGSTSYKDEIFGEITLENSEMRDQVLIKADGYPTYNFCHVIDDHLMGVTHVVRGNEYLTSTPKYCLLYDAFGWERPVYCHLPLLMGKDAEGNVSKLSKRHGSVSFQDLLTKGFLSEAIVNYIALLGWCPKDSNQEFFTLKELEQEFSLDAVSKSPSVFDYEKLRWFNSEYIKKLSPEEFLEKAMPYLTDCPEYVDKQKLAALLHTRVSVFEEIPEMIDFATKCLQPDDSAWTNKKNKTNPEICKEIIRGVLPVLKEQKEWDNDSLFALLKTYSSEAGYKAGAVMWAVRVGIARQSVTPGGATELMEVFGKDESVRRLEEFC